MSGKNRDLKRLLATICGVASTLGGGAASAKGGSSPNKGNVKPAVSANGNIGFTGTVKRGSLKPGWIVGGGIGATTLTVGGIFLGYKLLSKGKTPDGKGKPPTHMDQGQDQDQDQDQDPIGEGDDKLNPPKENAPPANDGFLRVTVKNFKNRPFLKKSKDNKAQATTMDSDVERDGEFVRVINGLLKEKGKNVVNAAAGWSNNVRAFTDQRHGWTVYIIKAERGSDMRNALCEAARGRKMLYDDYDSFLVVLAAEGFFSGHNIGHGACNGSVNYQNKDASVLVVKNWFGTVVE